MAGSEKLLWVLAAIAGAGAVLVVQAPNDLPDHPWKTPAATARYATIESVPMQPPGLVRAAGPTSTESPHPDQGTPPPQTRSEPVVPGATSPGATDTDYLSPESAGALTRSSAPNPDTLNVGVYIDPEGYQPDSGNSQVLVGEYLDPEATIDGD
jgi:hypothetical protein